MSQLLDKVLNSLISGDKEAAANELHQHLNIVMSRLVNSEPNREPQKRHGR